MPQVRCLFLRVSDVFIHKPQPTKVKREKRDSAPPRATDPVAHASRCSGQLHTTRPSPSCVEISSCDAPVMICGTGGPVIGYHGWSGTGGFISYGLTLTTPRLKYRLVSLPDARDSIFVGRQRYLFSPFLFVQISLGVYCFLRRQKISLVELYMQVSIHACTHSRARNGFLYGTISVSWMLNTTPAHAGNSGTLTPRRHLNL